MQPRGLIRPTPIPRLGIPDPPLMHRLVDNPIPARHIAHRLPAKNLEHYLEPLLHKNRFRPPPTRVGIRKAGNQQTSHRNRKTVAQYPEPRLGMSALPTPYEYPASRQATKTLRSTHLAARFIGGIQPGGRTRPSAF
jgi:hypothetical protein